MNIIQIPIPQENYRVGRFYYWTLQNALLRIVGKPAQTNDLDIFHWMAGHLVNADSRFRNPTQEVSATFGIEDDTVHQYVKLSDTTYNSGNGKANTESVSYEISAQPGRDASDSSYESVSQVYVLARKARGLAPNRATMFGHNHFKATACPGTIDIDRIYRRAVEIFNSSMDGIDQPVAANPIQATVASAPIRVPINTSYQFSYNLSPGMVGEEVGKLQDKLIELSCVEDIPGMRAGRGTYGPRTSKAVATFQERHGIIKGATDYGAGYFGPITRSTINKL